MERILITAALPYANGPLHIGHLAGAYLPADIFARFQRLKENDVLFICGSDEHGVPITIAAEKEGVSPQDIVDRYHTLNKSTFASYGISFDYYGRTSSVTHRKTAQEFFLKLHEKGVFVKKEEEQLFDEEKNMFLPDRYVKGTCPICGYEEAYGDQCERCGSSLSPAELIEPRSALSGTKPIKKITEHWYLPLGESEPWLRQWIQSNDTWKSNVRGQCLSWLDAGLTDRAMTRDLAWGVPVPIEGAEGKVLYVWFDAPIGYISATKEFAEQQSKPELWKMFWQDEESRLIHFIGKDNIVFHCIIFPSLLKSHGDFILPENVPANEFLNLEGRKLSTSKGWAVWMHEALEDFEADDIRFVITSTMPESKDSDFSWSDFQTRINSELADIVGNFTYRSISFCQRFFDGAVPELVNPDTEDTATLSNIRIQAEKIEEAIGRYQFRLALSECVQLARLGNKYFTDKEPWKTNKTDKVAAANTIHVALQLSAALSIMLDPFVPSKAERLRSQLGVSTPISWKQLQRSDLLKTGIKLKEGEIIFKKIDDELIEKQLNKLKAAADQEKTAETPAFPPLRPEATFDDFMKLDLRVARILEVERVKKSNKLYKLLVDVGFEKRTVVSGIAKDFSEEELLNAHVVLLANLKPRKIMGIESQGMILMAEKLDGSLAKVVAHSEPGTQLS